MRRGELSCVLQIWRPQARYLSAFPPAARRAMVSTIREVSMKKLLLALACIAGFTGGAVAEDYPSRPIVMVVPLGVGGSTDVVARLMAEGLRRRSTRPSSWRIRPAQA